MQLNRESIMEVYDTEFALRLDIIDTATAHLTDPSVELLVGPIRSSECSECPWKDWCRPILEQGSGDLSLVPFMSRKARTTHLGHHTADRAALAALDYRTASLVADRVDLTPVMDALGFEPLDSPLQTVIGKRRRRQL